MFRRTLRLYWSVWILFGAAVLYWHRLDTRPPLAPESVHLNLAMDWHDQFARAQPLADPWTSARPPLGALALMPALSVHPSQAVAAGLNLLYAAIFLWAMMQLAIQFGRPGEDGLLAAFAVLGAPFILFLGRRAFVDFSVLAWVTAGMAFLLRTAAFTDRGATLVWGSWSGIGILITPFYPVYFVLPCLTLLWQGPPLGARRPRPLHNFLQASGIILLVAVAWYGWRWPIALHDMMAIASGSGAPASRQAGPPVNAVVSTVLGWWFYFQAFWTQWGPWTLGFIVVGLGLLSRYWHRSAGKGAMIAWALSTYLLFTFIHHKDARFTVPMMPALALLALMGWLPVTAPVKWRRYLWAALTALFAANVLTADRPRAEEWKHDALNRFMQTHRDSSQPFLLASVVSKHPAFSAAPLQWSMRAGLGRKLWICRAGNPDADFTEFIVVKSSGMGLADPELAHRWNGWIASGRSFTALYPRAAAFQLPDGSQALLYQRNRAAAFQVGKLDIVTLERKLAKTLTRYIQGPFQIVMQGSPNELKRGQIAWATIEGKGWTVRKIPIAEARIRVDKAWLNLYRLYDQGRSGVLAVHSVAPDLTINARDLEKVLMQRVVGLHEPHITFTQGRAEAQGIYRGLPIRVVATLELQSSPRRLVATLQHFSIHGIPIPGWFLGAAYKQTLPLDPTPEFPASIEIHRVTLEGDVLHIVS